MNTNKVIASNLIKIAKKLIAGTGDALATKEFDDFAKKLDSSKKSFNEFKVEFSIGGRSSGGKVTGAVNGPDVNYPMYIFDASVYGKSLEQNIASAKVYLKHLTEQVASLKNAIAYCEKTAKDLQKMEDNLPEDVKKALGIIR